MTETPKQVQDRKAVGLERLLNWLFNHKVIVNCDRDPYLLRWYVIRTERVGVFIHKFVRSDEDRALHDHPWDFIVIPIWRGYFEHSESRWGDVSLWDLDRMTEPIPPRTTTTDLVTGVLQVNPVDLDKVVGLRRRVRPFLGTRFRRGTYRHRVELIEGRCSWSIFIRFRKFRDWGFWPKDGFILNSTWWKERCD